MDEVLVVRVRHAVPEGVLAGIGVGRGGGQRRGSGGAVVVLVVGERAPAAHRHAKGSRKGVRVDGVALSVVHRRRVELRQTAVRHRSGARLLTVAGKRGLRHGQHARHAGHGVVVGKGAVGEGELEGVRDASDIGDRREVIRHDSLAGDEAVDRHRGVGMDLPVVGPLAVGGLHRGRTSRDRHLGGVDEVLVVRVRHAVPESVLAGIDEGRGGGQRHGSGGAVVVLVVGKRTSVAHRRAKGGRKGVRVNGVGLGIIHRRRVELRQTAIRHRSGARLLAVAGKRGLRHRQRARHAGHGVVVGKGASGEGELEGVRDASDIGDRREVIRHDSLAGDEAVDRHRGVGMDLPVVGPLAVGGLHRGRTSRDRHLRGVDEVLVVRVRHAVPEGVLAGIGVGRGGGQRRGSGGAVVVLVVGERAPAAHRRAKGGRKGVRVDGVGLSVIHRRRVELRQAAVRSRSVARLLAVAGKRGLRDGEGRTRERNRVVGVRRQGSLTDGVSAHGFADLARQIAGKRRFALNRAGRGVGERGIRCAIDLRLRLGRHGERTLGDGHGCLVRDGLVEWRLDDIPCRRVIHGICEEERIGPEGTVFGRGVRHRGVGDGAVHGDAVSRAVVHGFAGRRRHIVGAEGGVLDDERRLVGGADGLAVGVEGGVGEGEESAAVRRPGHRALVTRKHGEVGTVQRDLHRSGGLGRVRPASAVRQRLAGAGLDCARTRPQIEPERRGLHRDDLCRPHRKREGEGGKKGEEESFRVHGFVSAVIVSSPPTGGERGNGGKKLECGSCHERTTGR